MKFFLEDLLVYFPYPTIYTEQYEYMLELKHTIEGEGHAILEMPTGTGKTITLFSVIVAYIIHKSPKTKLIYCTRTVVEIEKALQELQNLFNIIEKETEKKVNLLAMGMASRKNYCSNPTAPKNNTIDSYCRSLTSSWVRVKYMEDIKSNINKLCPLYEGLQENLNTISLLNGVYGIEKLTKLAETKNVCPYFLARNFLPFANIVVYNYQYIIDPNISSLISKEFGHECIVVFDEAHNMDNVCIECLSVNLNKRILDIAQANITSLRSRVKEFEKISTDKLKNEYNMLVKGLCQNSKLVSNHTEEELLKNPFLEKGAAAVSIPGSIRKANPFLSMLITVIMFFKDKLKLKNSQDTQVLSLPQFTNALSLLSIDTNSMK